MNTELEAKIRGCWLGKAIGGTLGTPHEGKTGPLDLHFYDPVPTGILPNDDLDLQLVWLHHLLETRAAEVTPAVLLQAWQRHVGFPFDEYGICLRNAAYGCQDERLGSFDNWFSECMGAAIRSELWACVAPGQPERAAAFAWSDAVCDHAQEGVWAEIYLAALESAAFVTNDRERLLDLARGFLPASSRVHRAIQDTRKWWRQRPDWRRVRREVMSAYGDDNFTDVAANLAFTVLGWLAGEGDFGQSILIANNCGQDTDCTAATLGSLLGILAPDTISDQWKAPIGENIVLSPQIVGLTAPPTLGDLIARTLQLKTRLADARPIIGGIAPREPAGPADSPVGIPVRIEWSGDRALFDARAVPGLVGTPRGSSLPGHWVRREAADFSAPVQVLRFRFRLERAQSIRVCGWSQTQTAVWIDGTRPAPVPADPAASYCQLGAPSFHRGGRGHFRVTPVLARGEHDLVVAWEAPTAQADLVVGIADADSKQWLPWALAESRR